MKKNYGIFVLLSVAMGLTACDDGSIPRKEHTATHTGFAAKLTGHITGADYASARQPRREQQREPHPA